MNSIERVKATLNFEDPDRVPFWKALGESDVFTMAKMPSKNWKPGREKDEKGLFPYVGSDLIIKSKIWIWDKPEWAKDSKYEKWLDIPREEVDEWGNVWKRAGINTMGHPIRPSLLSYEKLDAYLEKHTPNLDEKERYSLFVNLSKKMGKDKYRICSLDLGPFQLAANMRGFINFIIVFCYVYSYSVSFSSVMSF